MSSYGPSTTWCLCEKLPRSILHIAPPPELWCDVCGRRRRPRGCLSSSSDEEEKAAVRRQQMLAERRRAEEARLASVRVKVAMNAKKPKSMRKTNCVKCGGATKQPTKPKATTTTNNNNNNNKKLYIGRFGHYRKPQRVPPKRKDEEPATGAGGKQIKVEPVATALPPPPSPPPSPSPPAKANESLWEQPSEDMPNLVAFAHEVFNRPLHLRKRQPSFYDNLFVSDFIPLDKPITDSAGGAISKQRKLFGRPLRSHCSRPLPPLSQVLSEILAKPKIRAKGGGLAPTKGEEPSGGSAATQFSPFDSYEGPSEDALVVDSARVMLRQSKALHIKQRADLPTTRLSSFESEPSSDCSSSSPIDMPSAPPAERERHNYGVGAPLRLHEMMKAVAHSGLSDSSASSSSTSSSSHKSAGSTLPAHQQSVRSRGGEEPPYTEEKPAEPDMLPISIIEKILWLMEQKPPTEPGLMKPLTDDDIEQIALLQKQDELIEDGHTESVKGLLQFMESLHISEPGPDDILENDGDELKIGDTDPDPPNDMSNELPLNSTNKSAGDTKYANVFSTSKKCRAGKTIRSKSSTSMWSIISGLFSGSGSGSGTVASKDSEERKPLKSAQSSHYGSIKPTNPLPARGIPQNCHKCGKKKSGKQQLPKDSSGTSTPKVAPQYKPKKPRITTNIEKPIVNRTSFKATVNNELAECSTPIRSATSSTQFESCFGIALPSLEQVAESNAQKRRALRTKQLKELLHTIRANERKQSRVHHKAKTIGTVQYVSSEIIEPKMVAFAREANKGQLQANTVSLTIARPLFEMLEFRTPDIQTVKLVENLDESSTPIAHSETGQQSEQSSVNCKNVAERKNRALLKHNLPVWPPHPFRHRKRHIKYTTAQLELSYTVSDENICIENNQPSEGNVAKKHKTFRIRENISENWIVNKTVQQKITEMMTKPIKLLTVNETN